MSHNIEDKNIAFQNQIVPYQLTLVSKADRERLNGHRGAVLWFTGLSGSGKSTLANVLDKRLYDQGIRTYLLDGDNVRQGLNRDLGFSKAGRTENIRRVAEVAKLFLETGMIVIVAFISPYQIDRQLARDIIGTENFLEIYVQCSLEECERRDPKGLYVKARRGEIANFTGITDPYEGPENPEIIVRTEEESAVEATERIFEDLKTRSLIGGSKYDQE
jgi:adenylyl-sulfate kinase